MIYNNFWDLIEATAKCAKENKSHVYLCDEPKQMLIGYGCPCIMEDDKIFSLKINTIRSRKAFPFINAANNDLVYILEKLILTTSGRKQIVEMINDTLNMNNNHISNLLRFLKLKTFW